MHRKDGEREAEETMLIIPKGEMGNLGYDVVAVVGWGLDTLRSAKRVLFKAKTRKIETNEYMREGRAVSYSSTADWSSEMMGGEDAKGTKGEKDSREKISWLECPQQVLRRQILLMTLLRWCWSFPSN